MRKVYLKQYLKWVSRAHRSDITLVKAFPSSHYHHLPSLIEEPRRSLVAFGAANWW